MDRPIGNMLANSPYITVTNQFGQNPTQVPNPNYQPITPAAPFGDITKPSSADSANTAGAINTPPSVPNTVPSQVVNIMPTAKKTDVATPALIVGAILILKFWILH